MTSISGKDIAYVSYCPRCKYNFGHIERKSAKYLYKKHLDHCIDVEPLKPTLITPEIETMILHNLQEEWKHQENESTNS